MEGVEDMQPRTGSLERNSSVSEGRRGTVWLAFDGRPDVLHWFGYWDQEPNGPPAMLENGPGWASAKEAILWGLQRTGRVFIRVDDHSEYWWAGDGDPPDDIPFEGIIKLTGMKPVV